MLKQGGEPVKFFSKRLQGAELKYPVNDQEILVIVKTLQKWRHLVIPAETILYKDHQALKYLEDLKGDKTVKF